MLCRRAVPARASRIAGSVAGSKADRSVLGAYPTGKSSGVSSSCAPSADAARAAASTAAQFAATSSTVEFACINASSTVTTQDFSGYVHRLTAGSHVQPSRGQSDALVHFNPERERVVPVAPPL